MSLKNLSVNKIPKALKTKLLNKRIKKLYQIFDKKFNIKKNFVVAVSGGPDSLALAFLTKIYSIKNNLKNLIINILYHFLLYQHYEPYSHKTLP